MGKKRDRSSELYALLKRPDEKYLTERAYDNAKFVEDIVRDAALALNGDPRVRSYKVEAENFESIHNHSGIRDDRVRQGPLPRMSAQSTEPAA